MASKEDKGSQKQKTKRWKGVLLNVGISLIMVILMLLVAEVFLRIFWPQNLNITKLDAEKVFILRPGMETVLNRADFTSMVTISSQGLRDKEYSLEKPADTKRIAVIGDSFSFGFGVEAQEAFPKVLERKLNGNPDQRYEILNFGVSGYGTEQEYLTLKGAMEYDPDIIILQFALSDIKENIKFNLFALENGTLKALPQEKITFSDKARNIVSWNSHLYSLFYFSVINNPSVSGALIKLHILKQPFQDPKEDFDVIVRTNQDSLQFDKAMEKTRLLLGAMNAEAKNKKIPFLVLIVPTNDQIDAKVLGEFAKRKNIPKESLNATRADQLLLAILGKERIPVIYPLEDFKKKGGSSLYNPTDEHWNKKGHIAASDVLYGELKKRGWA